MRLPNLSFVAAPQGPQIQQVVHCPIVGADLSHLCAGRTLFPAAQVDFLLYLVIDRLRERLQLCFELING